MRFRVIGAASGSPGEWDVSRTRLLRCRCIDISRRAPGHRLRKSRYPRSRSSCSDPPLRILLWAPMASQQTKRIALTVQYDGGPFYGWQLQSDRRSVQGELERVLERLFTRPARVRGSGRTDRGVHATGQVASVDAPLQWTPSELRRGMNALLPQEVWIAHAAEVGTDFHPRYAAIERSYIYRIGIADEAASPFHGRWCWPIRRAPDVEAMLDDTQALIGDHSFLAFAKAGQEHRGDRCIVRHAGWEEWGELGLEFHVTANRFLHHMVRYLVGTLVEIGIGRRPPSDIAKLLNQEPTLRTSPPAPPEGLFLSAVRYPPGLYDRP